MASSTRVLRGKASRKSVRAETASGVDPSSRMRSARWKPAFSAVSVPTPAPAFGRSLPASSPSELELDHATGVPRSLLFDAIRKGVQGGIEPAECLVIFLHGKEDVGPVDAARSPDTRLLGKLLLQPCIQRFLRRAVIFFRRQAISAARKSAASRYGESGYREITV